MFGVYCSMKSGGHINPAVTFANCVYRKFPWRRFPIYAIAQILGAMVGAAIVYGNYKAAFDFFEGGEGIRTVVGENATAGVFCTYPAPFMTRTGMFFSEVVASAILMLVIYALVDNDAGHLMPLALFFLIFGIGACFGWETGYAINLARDFGPRLVSYMIGYGDEVWSAGGYYFWVCSDAFSYCGRLSCRGSLLIFPLNHPCRSQWWPHSSAASWAASSTTRSCTPARAPSTRRGWASSA